MRSLPCSLAVVIDRQAAFLKLWAMHRPDQEPSGPQSLSTAKVKLGLVLLPFYQIVCGTIEWNHAKRKQKCSDQEIYLIMRCHET